MRQTLPSLSPEHAAAARGHCWEKPPWSPPRGSSTSWAHQSSRQSSGGGGTAEPLPSARARPWLPAAAGLGAGSAVEISIVAAARAGGGAGRRGRGRSHSASRGRKGSGWDNPRAGPGGAALSPGPGADSRFSRALGQRQELLLPPQQELQASLVRRQIYHELNSVGAALAAMSKLL